MTLHQTNWWSAPKNGDRLLVYVPADEQSRMALNTLAAQANVQQPNAPYRPKKTAQ
jgi:predicted RNA-binding protein (virulence factor B family)